jgi:hypothetical protein
MIEPAMRSGFEPLQPIPALSAMMQPKTDRKHAG